MAINDPLIFESIQRIEVPVTLGKESFILLEPDGAAVTKWRNKLLKGTRIGSDGKPSSLDGIADSEPYLVSLCLYYTTADKTLPTNKDGEPDPKFLVPLQKIQKWPSRIQTSLFERCKEIGGLNEVETVETLKDKRADLDKRLSELEENNHQSEEDLSEEAAKN